MTGCGSTHGGSAQALRLEREDLAAVAEALSGAEPEVREEVARTKAAWPQVANGLPRDTTLLRRGAIRTAARTAATLKMPPLLEEHAIGAITGPGAQVAGSFRTFILLTTRGWRMIGAAIDEIEGGTPTAASFARANVNLYVESVYDSHYSLAQLGKTILAAYEKLGGADAFGGSLSASEVGALAAFYSEATARLHPHDGVRFGS